MVYISGGNELLDTEEVFKHLNIKSGMKIGDLGCGGAGHFTIPAAKKVGSQGVVYAVDILKSVLRSVVSRARMEGLSNIKTVWSNLEMANATKITSESLDVVFLINILFQSKQDENIIAEANRLLKKGGELLVIDWKQSNGSFGPPAIDRIKPEAIRTIAKKINLKLIEEFRPGNYHFGLVFQKP